MEPILSVHIDLFHVVLHPALRAILSSYVGQGTGTTNVLYVIYIMLHITGSLEIVNYIIHVVVTLTLLQEKSDGYKMLLSPGIRKGLTSPVTGRIKLPPPTPRSERAKPSLHDQHKSNGADASQSTHIADRSIGSDRAGSTGVVGGSDISSCAPTSSRYQSASEMSPSASTVLFRTPGSAASGGRLRDSLSTDDSDGSDDGDVARLACDSGGMDMAPPRAGRIGSSNSILASIDVNRPRTASGSGSGHAKRNYSYSMGGGLFSAQIAGDRENSLRSANDKSK